MRLDLHVTTRDRATEVALLLSSLLRQTFQEWDLYLMDDGSGTPLQSFHFINSLIQRLRYEGHLVMVMRNHPSRGVVRSRQALVDHCLEHGKGEAYVRLDDDTWLEPDYLALLVAGAGKYDIVSGVTPPIMNPDAPRETRFVEPVINRVVLDSDGGFVINCDDCGHAYDVPKLLPAHHFRSNALIKKKVFETISYEDVLTGHGFREEEFFSFRALRAGFSVGVHTGAVAWHFAAPSGGERSHGDVREATLANQRLLNRLVKRWHKKEGDFIQAYNDRLGVSREGERVSLSKETNLIYTTEE